MSKLHPAPWKTLSLTGALIASLATTASCAPQANSTRVAATTDVKPTGGVIAAIDPCTGELVAPTPAQRDALSRQQGNDDAQTVTEAEAQASLTTNPHGLVGASMKVPTNRMNHLGTTTSSEAATRQSGDHANDRNPAATDRLSTGDGDCVQSKNPVR